jgi:hypothetical protein
VVSGNGKLSMAASRDGLFGHFPPWDNQGATGKGSLRPSRTFTLIKKPGNYSYLSDSPILCRS